MEAGEVEDGGLGKVVKESAVVVSRVADICVQGEESDSGALRKSDYRNVSLHDCPRSLVGLLCLTVG